ncbi:MAG: adenylosuccinate synthase, partial [Planctomycetota bacterium]
QEEKIFAEEIAMPGTALIGLQWGDEGKGKVIDHLSDEADVVVRFQGGGNAGHTVVIGEKKFILHHLPSGILHPGKVCIIGPGVVVDPVTLAKELAMLDAEGIDVTGRLFVCTRTHIVLPHHRLQDAMGEKRKGDAKIGTTGRGIGPVYEDKMSRIGFRMGDLLDPALLEKKIPFFVEEKRRRIGESWTEEYEAASLQDFCRDHAERLRPRITDSVALINRFLAEGKEVLFEGAQGTLLDVDLGTYPFVTSSNTTVGGIYHGAGVAPRWIRSVVGVVKAYMTRVGAGVFPSELHDETASHLREKGVEFGSTTGRPRRCGWLDAVAGTYAVTLNGVDTLAVTKLDVLSGLDEVSICTAYERNGERLTTFDSRVEILSEVKPVWETLPGWKESLGEARTVDALPPNCRAYLDRMESVLGARIGYISVGPERSQIIEVVR